MHRTVLRIMREIERLLCKLDERGLEQPNPVLHGSMSGGTVLAMGQVMFDAVQFGAGERAASIVLKYLVLKMTGRHI